MLMVLHSMTTEYDEGRERYELLGLVSTYDEASTMIEQWMEREYPIAYKTGDWSMHADDPEIGEVDYLFESRADEGEEAFLVAPATARTSRRLFMYP